MTDNVIASAAIGVGANFATKDIAGVQFPRNIITDAAGVDITPAKDATLTGGAAQTKLTDGTNPVGVTAAATAGNELTVDRLKVNASLRMIDTSLTAGSQLVAARGDQTTGLWVNVKNASVPVTGAVPANTTTSGTLTASDAVVAAPIGDGTLVTGASTAGSIVYAAVPDGFQAWTLLIKGYVSGTIYTEASNNTTNGTDGDWVEVKGRRTGTAPGTESVVYAMVANGYYRGNAAGFKGIRARLIGGTGPTIQWQLSNGMGATFLNSGIPSGSSAIGSVKLLDTGGTNVASISAAGAVKTDGSAVTQPVSFAQQALPANQTVSVALIGGTAPAMNTGVRAAGVQRVTVATDDLVPVTANDLTASGSITTQNLVPGGVATAGSAVEIALNGQNTLGVQVTGTYTGALSFQGTMDGSTWVTVGSSIIMGANGVATSTIASAAQSTYQIPVAGYAKGRITGLAAMTGTAVVTLRATLAASVVQLGPSSAGLGSVSVSSAPAAGTNLSNDIGVQYRASSTGGASVAKILTAATTNATCPKASAGRLLGWTLQNTTAAVKVVHIHDLAVAPTVGTSVPKFSIVLPANGSKETMMEGGMAHATGIAYSITGAIGDLDTTITGVGDVIGALYFA